MSINHSKRLASLEALRALAALAVVVYHGGAIAADQGFIDEPTNYSYWGKYGVHVFFCLSGFVICFVHYDDLGKPDRCARYLWRRWARIWPLYAAITIAQAAFSMVTGIGEEIDLSRLMTSLMFLDLNTSPIVTVGWTLVHEAFFYFIFVVFMLVNRRLAAWGFVAFILIQALMEFFPADRATLSPWVFHQLRWLFISGIGGALVVRDLANRGRLSALSSFQIGIMLILLVLSVNGGQSHELTTNRLFRALLIQTFLVGVVVLEKRGVLNFSALLTYLGKASYSIYLVHATFMSLGLKICSSKYPQIVSDHIYLVITILGIGGVVVGIVTHETLEKSLTNLTKRLPKWHQSRKELAMKESEST